MNKKIGRKPTIIILALQIALAPVFYFTNFAQAEVLNNRSVAIGSSLPSATTTNNFSFTIPTAGPLGSVEFEYCSNSPFVGTACTSPTGLDVSGVVLSGQTGETGFAVASPSTANRYVITRAPIPNLAFQTVTYNFSNIINPSSNDTTYIRISTFASIDATGPRTDSGAVAFSTASNLLVEGYVPPYLTFCVAVTVSLDCSSLNGNFISLGELSKTSANTATSQFSGATNDPGGYSAFIAGNTMTSGTNTLPALGSAQASTPGSSQFGINLVNNSNPNVGQNPSGSGSATPRPGFGSVNQFRFTNTTIASSSLPTNFKVFTVSYLVNVSTSQKPGVYSTTLTYIATAAF